MGRGRSRSRSPPAKKDKKSRRRSQSSEDDRKASKKNGKEIKSPARMETRSKYSKFTKFMIIFNATKY